MCLKLFELGRVTVPSLVAAWSLGKGESEVIAFALENRTFEVVIDDRPARRCAEALGIPTEDRGSDCVWPGDCCYDLPTQEGTVKMKVHYDREVDALYLGFGVAHPDGVVELSEGVNLDTTEDGRLAGIEILDASRRIDLDTILSYSIDLGTGMSAKRIA